MLLKLILNIEIGISTDLGLSLHKKGKRWIIKKEKILFHGMNILWE